KTKTPARSPRGTSERPRVPFSPFSREWAAEARIVGTDSRFAALSNDFISANTACTLSGESVLAENPSAERDRLPASDRLDESRNHLQQLSLFGGSAERGLMKT